MDFSVEERLAKLELSARSHFTSYNFLFVTAFASLFDGRSDAEFERARNHMLDVLRFNMKGVPSDMPDEISMQVQANAVGHLEWMLNAVADTRRKAAEDRSAPSDLQNR